MNSLRSLCVRLQIVPVGSLLLVGLLGFAPVTHAQTAATAAPVTVPVSLIAGPVNDTARVTLRGNTHPLARAQYDQGAVPDNQPMNRMLLLLQRSQAQETALRALLDQQQSLSSPSYHQWLTPQQFGQQFGPAASDIQAVTTWLSAHGFQVSGVAPGGTVIEFSGNAGQVRSAFNTQIHKYLVNGQTHYANSTDPQIPAALAPLVAGTVSLHNFPRKAQNHVLGRFRKNKATGEVKPQVAAAPAGNSPSSTFTFSSSGCPLAGNCYALGPTDFATVYNILPLYSASPVIDGSGQTIAIIGDSEICTVNSPSWMSTFTGPNGNTVTCNSDDVATFRSLFGLSAKSPNVILDGPDPGFTYDETEGDLDVEWSGAVARNATIDFVIAADTEASAGIDLAALHVVENNLAPVMSESFGECEAFLGSAGNQFYSELWEQAAAQGITVIISSADSGSAACDDPDLNSPNEAENGVFVNGIASTPFNVAAGGTDFDITASNYQSTYWTSNTPGTEVSAKSYIPETTWNDSCAQSFLGLLTGCNSPLAASLNIVGGGGGQSNCTANNGTNCTAFYAKPAWQSGSYITGTPSTDGTRDVPDISLFSADGFVSGSFYVVCQQDLNASDVPCSLSGQAFFDFIGVGGTSSAAPTFAGIMALVNQKQTILHGSNALIPTKQGNANYVLYPLANAQKMASLSCGSSSAPNASCTFNDVTAGNNSVPCVRGTSNCTATGSIGVLTSGGAAAWNAGTGYDLATGLGTINAANLVGNWASVAGSFTPTTTTLRICGPTTCTLGTSAVTITHGQTIDVNATVTAGAGTPTGDVAFLGAAAEGGLESVTLSGGTTSTVPINFFPGGTYNVTAHYTGNGTFGASDSTGISVTVTPEPSTTSLSAPILNFVNDTFSTLTTPSGGSVDYGDSVLLRADVKGNSSGQEDGTGTVTFKDGSTVLGTVNLNAEGYAELQTGANADGFSTTPLSVGSHNVTATYNGDPSMNASAASATLPVTVATAPTAMSFPAQTTSFTTNSSAMLTVFVDTQVSGNPSGGSSGVAPTGTVTFTFPSSAMVAPPHTQFTRPSGWLILAAGLTLFLLCLSYAQLPARRRFGMASAALLLMIVASATISCGGGSSSGGGGGGGGTTTMTATLHPTTDANGFVAAQATVTFTATASQTITASYNGDGNYKAPSSTSIGITVH